MKIVSINSGNIGSTGNIMLAVSQKARAEGHVAYTACPDGRSMRKKVLNDHIYIGTRFGRNLHLALARITGLDGFFSVIDTLHFLQKIKRIQPDIIHLHNLHSGYLNLPLLFRYIKKHKIHVVWTLHDCWAFTGHCPHFTMAKCDKWKNGCNQCPQFHAYPPSLVDNSRYMWKHKKRIFSGVDSMQIVAPSQWLADLVKNSFLKDYPVRVINNGINLSIFTPLESDFREKYHCQDKFILLGVAFGWGERKGLDVFIELAKRLPANYQIVLVGTDEEIDKKLPVNIISIHRTENQKELAEIYSAADLFVNPTREEVFGLVNAEALACGSPMITFRTGGSPEAVNETCGSVVPCDDIDAMYNEIVRICNDKPYSKEACLLRAKAFDERLRFEEYIKLYHEIKE